MVGAGWAIVITVVLFAAVASVGWILYSRWRAQKLGLPPPAFTSFLPFRSRSDAYGPTPRSGGIQGWFGDQVTKFKNRNNRTAAGAYEGAPATGARGGTARGGFGALDPDAAWDAHVGDEADYGPAGYGEDEEHELGLGPYGRNSTAYEGAAHGGRGGPLGGSLGATTDNNNNNNNNNSYAMNLAATPRMAPEHGGEDELGGGSRGRGVGRNPFDDDAAEPSNLSLRGVSPRPMEGEHHHGQGGDLDSPTERRSVFTEQV